MERLRTCPTGTAPPTTYPSQRTYRSGASAEPAWRSWRDISPTSRVWKQGWPRRVGTKGSEMR
jgi:hypothetical protein